MKKNSDQLKEWHKLYDAAMELKKEAPWQWMVEQDLFAVQDPDTDELGFVSVMGQLGEHLSITVYRGAEGLYRFWDLVYDDTNISPEKLFTIPQLQVSFENRNFLKKQDLEIINKLGLRFRGKQSWPMFRSFQPGFVPWFLEPDEIRFLNHVLEQTLDISLRFRKDLSLLELVNDYEYLVRVPVRKNNRIRWHDSIKTILPPESMPITLSVDSEVINKLKSISPSDSVAELDFFLAPIPLQENYTRPYFPYLLLLVEADSGAILVHELLPPLPSLESMWGLVPEKVLEGLAKISLRPQRILIRSHQLYEFLLSFNDELDLSLEQSDKLPNLDQAKKSLLNIFQK